MADPAIDLTRPRRIHVVGVGGTGMNAVAAVLVGMGHTVSGSDVKPSAAVDRVSAQGVKVWIGHDPARIGDVDAVVTSTAVPDSNSEVRWARTTVCRSCTAPSCSVRLRRSVAPLP